MRILSRRIRHILRAPGRARALLTLAAVVAVATPSHAFLGVNKKKAEPAQETVDIYDLPLDENLYTPELGKASDVVADFQMTVARQLKKEKYQVELMRDGEVIVVTIFAGQLFNPNDTSLNDLGEIVLTPFVKYLRKPGMYKMILVMHSDDTGSPEYTLGVSRARVDAVYDWFFGKTGSESVVPYALGSVEPMLPNNSVENRKRNRRLEIFLVPDEEMIKQALKGKISL